MAVKIQIKRGSKAGLPALAPGEYGLATDTAELFVGGSSGNLQIPVLDSTGKVPSSQLPEMDYDPAGSAEAVQASLTAHVNDEDNPHGVTAAQVGAVNKLYVDDAIDEATAGSIKLSEIEVLLPAGGYWRSIIYGNGKFVVVGYNSNRAAYSTDGITWTEAALPSSTSWEAVTYGDGKFVVVGYNSNRAAYSTDGINWTAATLPSSEAWSAVTYGNGKFVAVSNSRAAYSTDGIDWTAATTPTGTSYGSVTYGGGKFVAVGSTFTATGGAAYSSDGIRWTAAEMPNIGTWSAVTYGNGKFVAVSNSRAAYSTDGIDWTAKMLPSSTSWEAVTYGDGKFVAVAINSDDAAYSEDGINWTASTLPSSANWYSVTYGNGKFVAAAGNITGKVAYSYDGITWLSTAQVLTDSAGDDITDDVAQALGVPIIEIVSYSGNGLYGSTHPCVLTFDSAPKFLCILGTYWVNGTQTTYQAYSSVNLFPGLSVQYGNWESYDDYIRVYPTFSGNTVSWYASTNAADQMNESGHTYYALVVR